MKILKTLFVVISASFLLLFISCNLFSPPDDSSIFNSTSTKTSIPRLTFDVTPIDNNGDRSPAHVMAVWIEDAQGNFIKTIARIGSSRYKYLYSWMGSSDNGNVVDALTSATFNSWDNMSFFWDSTDTSSQLVAQGDYNLWIEYTTAHAQGPKYSIPFTIGSDNVEITPPDQTYYRGMNLKYILKN